MPSPPPGLPKPPAVFRIEDAAADLVARARWELPGNAVVVTAPDEIEMSRTIVTPARERLRIQMRDLGRSPGHLQLYRFMRNPSGGMGTDGLAPWHYGCFYPSGAQPR